MRAASIVLVAVLMAFVTPASAEQACETFQKAVLYDVQHTFWKSVGETKTGRIAYVFGAPWCPHCRRLYNDILTRDFDVEFRFIPNDFREEKYKWAALDILKSEGTAGLHRTYATRDLAPAQKGDLTKFITDALMLGGYGVSERISAMMGKRWGGSPSFIFVTDGGGLGAWSGYSDFDKFGQRIGAFKDPLPEMPFKEFLEAAPAIESTGHLGLVVGDEGALIWTLPLIGSALGWCLDPGAARYANGMVEHDGERFYRVDGVWQGDGELVYGYIHESQVVDTFPITEDEFRQLNPYR